MYAHHATTDDGWLMMGFGFGSCLVSEITAEAKGRGGVKTRLRLQEGFRERET